MTRGTARARSQRVSLWFSTVKHQGAHLHWCTKALSASTAIEDPGLVCCCLTSAVVRNFFLLIFLADGFPKKKSQETSPQWEPQLAVTHMPHVNQGKAIRTACVRRV